MLALCRTESRLALEQRDAPSRRAGDALVRVRMAGICSTDLEIARGYMNFRGVLGHEFVGEVIEADDASWIGARVAGEINLACGACAMCQRDLPRHCSKRTVLGILGKDGAFAEYLTLPIVNLHRVPIGVPDRTAVFVEPVAACYEILEQLRVAPSDRVAVLGDGKLGQLIAAVLASRGAAPTLVGKHARKLALARVRGLGTAKPNELDDKTFDIVVEATGSPAGMQRAIALVRPRGTVVLKSTYHGNLSFDAAPLVIDEITVIGSRCGP
ncbi:MAG TPA: alcohol dehydrogenase catalytic domain-containing protein, partial [Polyangiales bacterium]|nr:alcohol dehydrogenase catalytic domain-containing protein [Polyangiales bacterium]